MSTTPRVGLTMVVEKKPTKKGTPSKSTPSKGKSGAPVINQKSNYEKNTTHRRGRPPIHDTAYIPNNRDDNEVNGNGDVVELELSESLLNDQPAPESPDENLKERTHKI